MKQRELADLILRALHRDHFPSGATIPCFNTILKPYGITDGPAIYEATNYLEDLGLIKHVVKQTEYVCCGNLSPKAVRTIEEIGEDESIIEALHRPTAPSPAVSISVGRDMHGPFALNSPNAKQKVERAPDEGLLAKLWGWAKTAFGWGAPTGK